MIRLLVLAAVFALVAAACSSGETAPAATASATPSTGGSGASTTSDPDGTSESTTTSPSTTGTMENPLLGGEFGTVGDWEIRVVDVEPDALEAVLAQYADADPPETGYQFFMISLEAQYGGTDSGEFWSDMGWKAVGPSAVAYEEDDFQCGFIPNSISDTNEAFPGGVVSGNLCWSVTAEDAQELVLLLEPFFAINPHRTAYRLDPTMAEVTPLDVASADISSFPAVELGNPVQVGDWKVSVAAVNPEATDVVTSEYEFADPPADGYQYVMATLDVEYTGPESSDFWSDLTWKALGPSSVTYGESTDRCGPIPDDVVDVGEVFAGGTFTANVCWSVTNDDVADLLMILEEFSMDNSARTFYRLLGGS